MPPFRADQPDGDSPGDAIEPTAETLDFFNLTRSVCQRQECGLEGIIDFCTRTDDSPTNGVHQAFVPLDNLSKRLFVGILSEPPKQFSIAQTCVRFGCWLPFHIQLVYLDKHPLRAIWDFLVGFADWPAKQRIPVPQESHGLSLIHISEPTRPY